MQVNPVNSIYVSLDVNSKHVFSLHATKKGHIEISDGNEIKISNDQARTFENLNSLLTPNILKRNGEMKSPHLEGDVCHIQLIFQKNDGTESGLSIIYGSKSKLPPEEIVNLVKKAKEVSENILVTDILADEVKNLDE